MNRTTDTRCRILFGPALGNKRSCLVFEARRPRFVARSMYFCFLGQVVERDVGDKYILTSVVGDGLATGVVDHLRCSWWHV